MEVSEEPVLIFQFSVHHLQKFREMVCLVVTVHSQSDAGGGAVGDYIVYSPVCLIQCPQGGVGVNESAIFYSSDFRQGVREKIDKVE